MEKLQKVPGTLLVVAAGVCWGLIGLFTRSLTIFGLSVLQIVLARCLFTLIGSFFVLLIFDRGGFKVRLKDLWIFIGTGVCSIDLFNMCYFFTIEHATLSVAAVLLYTAPCFVVAMSAIFFKDKITKKMWIALVLSMVGCVFTTGLIGSKLSLTFDAVITGVLSGFFYALYTIFGKMALDRKYKPTTLVFYTFLFGTLGILPFAKPAVFAGFLIRPLPLLFMVMIGLIATLLPYILYSAGLAKMEAGKAAIIAFVEPLTATLIGIIIFHEALTFQNAAGIILIFVATLLLNSKSGGSKPKTRKLPKLHKRSHVKSQVS